MLKKKMKFLAISIAAIMALGSLAACGGDAKEEAAAAASSAASAASSAVEEAKSEAAEAASSAASAASSAVEEAKSEAPAEEAASSASSAASEAPAEEGGEARSIVFCHKALDYYAYVAMEQAMKMAAEQRGWSFQSTVANQDAATQTNHVTNAIAQHPDAIVVDPIDSDGIVDALEAAQAEGIIAAVIDTPTNSGNFPTIVFDNYDAGKIAGERMVELLEKKYGEPKGVVVYPYGATSSSAWNARREGFEDVLAQYPDITYEGVPAEGDMQLSHDAIMNMAAKYDVIDGVHCPSDNPGLGMVEALKQLDMWHKRDEEGHVIFISIDGEPIAQDYIREGYYDASSAQDCSGYGTLMVEMLDNYYFKGEEMPLGTYHNEDYIWEDAEVMDTDYGRAMIIPAYLIDETNCDDERNWGYTASVVLGIEY